MAAKYDWCRGKEKRLKSSTLKVVFSPNTVSSSKEVRLIRVEESAGGAVGAREQSTVVRGHRRHRNQDAALFIFDNVFLVYI